MANAEPAVAVVDLGKTRAKVSVMAAGREITGRHCATSTLQPRGTSLDVDVIGRWCETKLAELFREHPFQHIVPVAHGATAVWLGAQGPLLPVRDYEAPVSAALSRVYDRLRPDFASSGSPALPLGLNLGRQLFAQTHTAPDVVHNATALLTYPQYWTWRWSGALGTDISSLGCHTDLWSPYAGDWSALARDQGWHRLFPPLVSAGRPAGPLTGALAERLDTKAITVHWGIHDSNAALAALPEHAEPFTLLSTGTWCIAFAVGGSRPALDPGRDTLCNVDVFGRPVPSARCMAGREREAIAGQLPAATAEALAPLLDGAALPLPAFAPGGPFAGDAGELRDSPAAQDPARAALASLYLALVIDAMLELIEAPGALLVEGPLARDGAALTALATLRPQQTVRLLDVPAAAHGAARLALGDEHWPAPALDRIVVPRPELHAPLIEKRRRWRAAIAERAFIR